MQRKSSKFLADMLAAATLIDDFARDRNFQDLAVDPMFRSAIYYQFSIIGEALAQLRAFDPETATRVTRSREIVDFRNQIIHGYAIVQDNITWQIIVDHLPLLKKELTFLLEEA